MPEADNRLNIHFDDDPGNNVIIEAHHMVGQHAEIILISANKALLDLHNAQLLYDWLGAILNAPKPANATTETIVAAINAAANREEAAQIYAGAMGMPRIGVLSFVAINDAITTRWSKSGLKYIKQQAWKIRDAQVIQQIREQEIPRQMRKQETTPCHTV